MAEELESNSEFKPMKANWRYTGALLVISQVLYLGLLFLGVLLVGKSTNRWVVLTEVLFVPSFLTGFLVGQVRNVRLPQAVVALVPLLPTVGVLSLAAGLREMVDLWSFWLVAACCVAGNLAAGVLRYRPTSKHPEAEG